MAIEGITSKNYMDYVKPNADSYGYNKGESDRPYLEGEEYFYNDYYDHWNVDKVYDEKILRDKGIIKDKQSGKNRSTKQSRNKPTTPTEKSKKADKSEKKIQQKMAYNAYKRKLKKKKKTAS